jgi:hypothetical protein
LTSFDPLTMPALCGTKVCMKAMAPFFSEYSLFLALGNVSTDRTSEAAGVCHL